MEVLDSRAVSQSWLVVADRLGVAMVPGLAIVVSGIAFNLSDMALMEMLLSYRS